VANVVLNVQPVLSTAAACLIFGDRLSRTFYPWAMLAVVAGIALVGLAPGTPMTLDAGAGYALLCALAWGLSTVAGRGVMVEMSLPLAAGLRVIVGLATMVVIVAARGQLSAEALWPTAAAVEPVRVVIWLVLLATLSGGVPLLVYFKGLELTRASTAAYFEMVQTLVAVVITWMFFHAGWMWAPGGCGGGADRGGGDGAARARAHGVAVRGAGRDAGAMRRGASIGTVRCAQRAGGAGARHSSASAQRATPTRAASASRAAALSLPASGPIFTR